MENESIVPRASTSSIFYSLASIALIIVGLIYFAGIIKPFVIAFLVWFIIDQLKKALGKITVKGKSLPGGLRSILAFLIIFTLTYLVTELLVISLEGIAASMPI